MPLAVSFLLAFLSDPSCEWVVVPLAEFHARLTAVCLSAIVVASVACIVRAVSNRRKLKHTAALLTLAIGMTIAAQKDLTNSTDGVSAPLPPMLQMVPRFGDPPDSVTNETETAALAFTSFFVSTNGVGFAMGWIPGLGLAYLDIRYSELLGTNDWSILDCWPVAPAQTNDTRFVVYGGSFTNAATGFFNLRGYTYNGDPDADGLSIGQELSNGTDPFAADTDGDGSSDGEELGTATVLTGEDFLWFDMPTAFNRVPTDRDSYWWLDNLDRGFRVGGERLGRIESSIDGFTHFYVSEIWNVWSYGWYDDAMAFRTNSLSGGFLTVAAANADLYARHDAWGSAFRYASVTTNGVTYYVLQCSNLGLKENRTGDSPLLSYEVIFSEDVPDVVYVSYGRVDEGIRSLDMKLGVQVAAWRNPLASDEYYTLMSPVAGSNLCAGTTIRYTFGVATDPLVFDTDGDGVPDGSDPLPHDAALGSYGQDETWVRMNFTRLQELAPSLTNAEEILSVGYADWVDAQVGVGLKNGLYKFTATFPSAPAEPTRLTVGGVPVLVNAAGDYVFLLEKGRDYEFSTSPFYDAARYSIEDDLASGSRVLASVGDWGAPGEWTVGGGDKLLTCPGLYTPGACNWLPTLRGSPDVAHLGPEDFPVAFTAELQDYRGCGDVEYRWSSTDANVYIVSPNSPSTQVTVDSLPDWGGFSMCVEAVFGGHSLCSYLPLSYGFHEVPQVRVEVQGPDHVWVNSPPSPDNVRTMSVSISSDVPTSGTFRVSFTGNEDHLGITRTYDWEFSVYEISAMPMVREFARLEGLSPCAACGEEYFSLTFQTADGAVVAGTNRLTVCRIAAVDVWSEKGGVSVNPPPFHGQATATFCITNSASPDQHYPVFFCDVVDTNLCIQPYSVEYRVATLPEDLNLAGAATTLTRLDGPPSGSLRNALGKTAFFDTPREGGVYKIGVVYGDSPVTETVLLLPLAGAAVDAVVQADRARADTRVAYVNSHFSMLQRQTPVFGLRWFNNDGMGDYLGRVDSVSKLTVWPYNQVNDETGMGAVGTWRGLPIRMAKVSNFLVGYTTKRIGVWSISRGLSQGIGTHNDESASMSWDAGVAIADGANFESTTGAMVTNAWKVSDQKERRLWPNPSPADNHTTRTLIRDFNLNFISPGFTERIPR